MKISASEQSTFDCALHNKERLFGFIADFQDALNLFDFLGRGGGFPAAATSGAMRIWQIIAARDGALNIYHFKCTVEAIRNQLSRCRSVPNVDPQRVRDALKIFRREFQNVENVRHAIAHAGELNDTPAKMAKQKLTPHVIQKHGLSGPPQGGDLRCALHDRKFSVGHEGDVFSVLLDQQTTATLMQIKSMVDSAFPAPSEQNEKVY